jgi:hypothetical protein
MLQEPERQPKQMPNQLKKDMILPYNDLILLNQLKKKQQEAMKLILFKLLRMLEQQNKNWKQPLRPSDKVPHKLQS